MTNGQERDDDVRTRGELIDELESLRRQVAALAGARPTEPSPQPRGSMITANRDLMAFVDRAYTYRAANQAYCDEQGRTQEEVIGQTVAEVVGEEIFNTKLKSNLDRCLSGESVAFDFWWNSPSRGRRHVDVRYDPYVEGDGSTSGVMVDVRDTTLQALTKKDLEKSVVALEVANRDLEAFGDSLAHDLKTPLLTVTNFSYYLHESLAGSLDEEQEDYLRRIRAAGEQMMYIIDDLRDLADVSRAELKQHDVDLSKMGRAIIDELSALSPDRRVDFEAEPGLEAVGDRTLLRLLLTNLLQNAWKYTGLNDPTRIQLGLEPDGEVPVYFVRDDGIGFDNAQRERIFRAFERLDTGGKFSGSGLGLATVERIVHRHGGRVWADGAPGKGAIFRFTLLDPRRHSR